MADSSGDAPLKRIVLIGFMGAGKTTVGAELARRAGWRHLDLDAWIEATHGAPVARIFAAEGEAAFRALETEATRAAASHDRLVVSTGGGWPLNPEHWRLLRPGGWFVWLRAGLETSLRRARADATVRPLLDGAAATAASALLAAREPLYAAADQVLDTDELTPAQVADDLLQRVRARILPA